MKKPQFKCECEKYKCAPEGKDSMKTIDKETGRVVQMVKATVANCVRKDKPKENKPPKHLREDEILWGEY